MPAGRPYFKPSMPADACDNLRELRVVGCTQIAKLSTEGHSNSSSKVIGFGHEKLYSEAFVKLLVAFFLEKRTPFGCRFSQLLKDIHYPNSGSCYMFSNWKALTIGPSWGRFKCIENASPKRQEDSTIYNHALMLHRNTINARILTKHRELHEYDSLK